MAQITRPVPGASSPDPAAAKTEHVHGCTAPTFLGAKIATAILLAVALAVLLL